MVASDEKTLWPSDGVFLAADGPDVSDGAADDTSDSSLLGGDPDELAAKAKENADGDAADTTDSDKAEAADGSEGGEEGKKAEEEGDAKDDGAPDKYEAFTLPEGMVATDDQLAAFSDKARELNLSQAQAQTLIEFEAERMAEMQQAQFDAWENQKTQWVEQIKADPEIGGRDQLQKQALAVRAVHRVGGEELVKALNETGAGNHPALVRAFYRIGLAMSEDHFKGNGAPLDVGAQKERHEILYGSDS